MREQDKHFLWSIFAAVGVIISWEALLGLIDDVPYVNNPWVLFFIGFSMLTISGVIFREFDPLGSLDKATDQIMNYVHSHPDKKDFQIVYYDKSKKENVTLNGSQIKDIEQGSLIMLHENGKQEFFVPGHRISEVWYKGKVFWKL